jgi:hypothetical protein
MESMYPLGKVEISVDNILDLSSRRPKEEVAVWGAMLNDITAYKQGHTNIDPSKKDIFYFGVFDKDDNDNFGLGGLAFLPIISNFSNSYWDPPLVGVARIDVDKYDFFKVTAHELGHNHARKHIASTDETNDNCGTPTGPDTAYTYQKGRIGKTGYSYYSKVLYNKDIYHDIMTYCQAQWISDYHYKKIYEFQTLLDTRYGRFPDGGNANYSTPPDMRVWGKKLIGVFTKNKWSISRKLEAKENDIIPTYSSDFELIVTLDTNQEYILPILLMGIDHSDTKTFNVFIPSTSTIKEIKLRNKISGDFVDITY